MPKMSANLKQNGVIVLENQKDYMKKYIVDALFKLMDDYDYNEIKIVDITQRAGVSRATFYRNFKTKEDIIKYYFDYNTTQFALRKGISLVKELIIMTSSSMYLTCC